MKFKFYIKESKLYDFLKFPRLLYYKEEFKKEFEDTGLDHNYKEIVMEDYLNLVKKAEDSLRFFSKEIEIFYMKQYLSDYDFIDLISRVIGIIGYEDEGDYLDMLLTLDEKKIKSSIIYSILVVNDDYPFYSEEIMRKAEIISSNNDDVISFIKDLPIEGGSKWNLFLIIEDPIKYMKMYVELMTRLLPIFEKIYEPYYEKIKNYGQSLVEFLNKSGSKGLKEITYSIVDPNILEDEEIHRILISVIFSYAISIAASDKDKYIAWGLSMEEAFKKMQEINENKIIERVQIFKNLSDRTRYEVLKLIASGETSTKEIANALGVSSATISYHINNFLTSKVLKLDKSNNKFGYVVDYNLLKETIEGFKKDLNFPN